MNLIQQHWKPNTEFVRMIDLTRSKIPKLKSTLDFKSSSFSETIAIDVIINYTQTESLKTSQVSEFQKYLLSWPEMTDEEFNFIKEKRKHFNEWK